MAFSVFEWMKKPSTCGQQHYHIGDPTCGTGRAPAGAQTGPHYHAGSASCHDGSSGDPSACNVPHFHVDDPTFRSVDEKDGYCCGG